MSERPTPVDRLLGALRALEESSSDARGRRSAMSRAEIVDACLRELFEAVDPPGGVALVALGGYGRRMLLPASDVDLLIVHDGARVDRVSTLAERVLYPLWDAGIRVGHAVRTPAECDDVAAGWLEAETSMLDGRVVAGDEAPWVEARSSVLGRVRSDPRGFALRLSADAKRRRERSGSVSSLLEPDLKDGGGGLRDSHALAWLEVALTQRLEAAGLLREAERTVVDEAEEFLTRVRSTLHLETGRANDRLSVEQQPAVAGAMGFVDEPGVAAVDALMRSVYEHARHIEHVSSSAFDRFLRGPSGKPATDPSPEGVLRAFVASVREDEVASPALLDAAETAAIHPSTPWSEEMRRAFLELLETGEPAVRALEILDRIGVLERLIPAWAAVRCRPQRDPYHRSPVDVHLLETFAVAAGLLEDPGSDAVAARAVEALRDRDALLVGALLHDIGKTGRGHHVDVGAAIAAETLSHMGIVGPTRELATFLVSRHLLLSDTATRRDLEDEDLVVDVATKVGDAERLAALYLLTISDATATGPLAWTPWRSTLVRELVAKVQRVLERAEDAPGAPERLRRRMAMVRDALAAEDPAAVDRFLERMPHGYLLTVPLHRVAGNLHLVDAPLGTHDVRTHAEDGFRPGTYELTVAARDRPGLLSMIAGALTLAGLSVLSAQVFTTDDGVALDLFEVEGVFDVEIEEERWRAFRGSLRRAIDGRLSLDYRVREKRALYPAPRAGVPVRVSVDNAASDVFTVIEVGAPDRLGLLFDITRTLAELHLDVHVAKVATYGERVVDAFYVRDELGSRVEDPERIAELELALRGRIEG